MPPRRGGAKRKRDTTPAAGGRGRPAAAAAAAAGSGAAAAAASNADDDVNASTESGYSASEQNEAKKIASRLFGFSASVARAFLRAHGTAGAATAGADAGGAVAAVAAAAAVDDGGTDASLHDGDTLYRDMCARRHEPHRRKLLQELVSGTGGTDPRALQCVLHGLVRHGLWRNLRVATAIVNGIAERGTLQVLIEALCRVPVCDARYDPHGSYGARETLGGDDAAARHAVVAERAHYTLLWRLCQGLLPSRMVEAMIARCAEQPPAKSQFTSVTHTRPAAAAATATAATDVLAPARAMQTYCVPRDRWQAGANSVVSMQYACEHGGRGDTWQHAWDRECGALDDARDEFWGSPLHVALDRLMVRKGGWPAHNFYWYLPGELCSFSDAVNTCAVCVALLRCARIEDGGDAHSSDMAAATVRLDTPRGHSIPGDVQAASMVAATFIEPMRGTARERLHRWLSLDDWKYPLKEEQKRARDEQDPEWVAEHGSDRRNFAAEALQAIRQLIATVNDVDTQRILYRQAVLTSLVHGGSGTLLSGITALIALVVDYALSPNPAVAQYPLPKLDPLPVRFVRPAAAPAPPLTSLRVRTRQPDWAEATRQGLI